eukprot:GHVH01000676.1.p1 GENE.GHVH01000676.1~~GHVH01000676.1.p1  ORF type:complete len:632 (+),score=56.72 GHVH01000676.1:187-2082(+)
MGVQDLADLRCIQDFSPYYLQDDKYHKHFNKQMQATDFHESFDYPLTNEMICTWGKHLAPDSTIKRMSNGLVFMTIDALRNERLMHSPYPFQVVRFYAGGDYCGTAVGAHRSAKIICYIERKDDSSLSDITKYLCSHLQNATWDDYDCPNPASMRIFLDNDGYISVHCEPIKFTFCLCDDKYSPSKGDFAEKVTSALADMASMGREMAFDFRPRLDEPYSRLITSLPRCWIYFIRFCKYWSSVSLGSHLPPTVVEVLCLKILLSNDETIGSKNFDSAKLFSQFIFALSDEDAWVGLDQVVAPTTIYQRIPFQEASDTCNSYVPQDAVVVDGCNFPMPSSKHRLRSLTGIFDTTVNLCSNMEATDWDEIREVSTLVYCTSQFFENKNFYVHAAFGWAGIWRAPQSRSYQSKGSAKLIRNLLKLLIMLFFLSYCTLVCLIDVRSGALDADKFAMISSGIETAWLQQMRLISDYGFSAILDSKIFGLVEDTVMFSSDKCVDLPALWDNRIPEGMKKHLMLSKDTYLRTYHYWQHFLPIKMQYDDSYTRAFDVHLKPTAMIEEIEVLTEAYKDGEESPSSILHVVDVQESALPSVNQEFYDNGEVQESALPTVNQEFYDNGEVSKARSQALYPEL